MDPLALQRQIRNNTNDLANFCSDLKQWGEEMKSKDEALKSDKSVAENLVTEIDSKPKKKPKKRIKASDYAAWEKFDVEAECAKLDVEEKDNNTDGDLTDEYDEDSHDQAVYEKEKGNKFVKAQNWEQAIACYTKAIEHYAYDPIFYANRALCYLKVENHRAAESDCTSALRLDKTYVKAYQRRAAAREKLGQLSEAHSDLLKVFDYEPSNKESKLALKKLEQKLETFNKVTPTKTTINQRPKSKFTISQQKKNSATKLTEEGTTPIAKPAPVSTYWSSGNDVELIRAVNKPPHLRSNKPLQRITIRDVDNCETVTEINSPAPWPRSNSDSTLIKCDDLKIVERRPISNVSAKKTEENVADNTTVETPLSIPLTSIQFASDWRHLEKCKELRYKYLKQINPERIPSLFKESLDYDIFSGIIQVLADVFVENNESVHSYLLKLSEVKRFSMLSMFMGDSDKKDLRKLADYMRQSGVDNVNELMSRYGL